MIIFLAILHHCIIYFISYRTIVINTICLSNLSILTSRLLVQQGSSLIEHEFGLIEEFN